MFSDRLKNGQKFVKRSGGFKKYDNLDDNLFLLCFEFVLIVQDKYYKKEIGIKTFLLFRI